MKTIHLPIVFFVLFLLVGCKESPKCKYKPPTPFFSTENEDVLKHSFDLKGMTSSESIRFNSGMSLTIHQAGCNKLEQEYRFDVPPAPKDDAAFWVGLAATQFDYVGKRSIELKPVAAGLSGIMMDQKKILLLGETYDLVDMGVSLKVDKINAVESSAVIVTVTELEGK